MRSTSLTAVAVLLVIALPALLHATTDRPPVRDFLGINGHTVVFKPELYAPICSLVRVYHPVVWDLDAHTETLPPFPKARNGVVWSDVYGSWKRSGFRIDASLMIEAIPISKWHDLDADAFAYGKAFAEHFGPSSQTPLVESIAIGNEPGNFTDAQYAQIFKAVAKGVRAGDRKMTISTCNLALKKSTNYAKSLATLDSLGELYDVLSIHTYAQLEPYPTWKCSFPEDARLDYLKNVSHLALWRDAHALGKPIWITEYGYDTTNKAPDPKTEFAKWVGVTDEQQTQYLVRSTLLFCALPVDRAYIYVFDDDDTPQAHGSSGLTRHFVPKPAYYAMQHFQGILGNCRFTRVLKQDAGAVFAFEFADSSNSRRRVIGVWSPTEGGRHATTALNLTGLKIISAQKMPTAKDSTIELPVPEATSIPVSEPPPYLVVE